MPENNVVQFRNHARASQSERLLIPTKLRDARKVARLSQAELGDLVGVTRQSISFYERGDKIPEPPTFQKISEALGQPASFFTSEDCQVFGSSGAQFYRKFGPETARRNDACTVLGSWFVQTARYFDDFVNYPCVHLPECAPASEEGYTIDEINEIATDLRRSWGLGYGPISNVLALVESKGVIVCRYEIDGENVEAFSFWNGERPFIFMASDKHAGVRLRYDVAHELGHLVLHKCVEQTELENRDNLRQLESEANKFAGAFLLPANSFPNEIYTTRLDAFLPLKARWKVSIQAMVHRCLDLEVIDADQHLNLYKQISFRKWRKKEPFDDPRNIPLEEPRLLRRAAELVIENGRKHPDEILNELRLSAAWIETFCNLPKGTLNRKNVGAFEPTLK